MRVSGHKIGVWLPNWVGDACMATPTLRCLADAFRGEAELVGIMKPVIREVLAGNSWFDQTVQFNRRASTGVHSRWSLVRALRQIRLRAVVLLTNSFWTAAVCRLAGVKRIIGYDRDFRSWLLTDRIPVPRHGKALAATSPVDYYLQLAHFIGGQSTDRRMRLSVLDEDRRRADQLWHELRFTPDVPTVVINNSGATAPSRLWPTEYVQALAQSIVDNHPWQVLLHSGPAERQSTVDIARRVAHERVRSMGEAAELPIGLSKGVLARASLVVSTDSGPRHLAAALDRPVIALFGSTDRSWTTTYNGHEASLEETVACRPCWAKTCPLSHHQCMRGLSVERVYQSVVETLSPLAAAGGR